MAIDTISVKLPPKLKARVAALARKSRRSAHSFIVEAVERHAEREERLQSFIKEALAADADIERTWEVYRADRSCNGQIGAPGEITRPIPGARPPLGG